MCLVVSFGSTLPQAASSKAWPCELFDDLSQVERVAEVSPPSPFGIILRKRAVLRLLVVLRLPFAEGGLGRGGRASAAPGSSSEGCLLHLLTRLRVWGVLKRGWGPAGF
jgi:hypothetical protein